MKATPRRICEKGRFKAGKRERERDEIQYSLVEFARSDSQRRSQARDHVNNNNLAAISQLYLPLSYTHTQP